MTTAVIQSPRRNLRAGFVGGGFMADIHSAASRAAGVSLAGIVSSSMARATLAATRLGVENAYRSLDELLDSDVDIIHICSPNVTHAPFALAALRAGMHVICEKPLAMSAKQAMEMVEVAKDSGKIASVPFVYRFHPIIREARERVRQGQIGNVLTIQGSYLQDWLLSSTDDNWRVDATIGGPSRAFADIGSHLCDLIEFVTEDRIVSVNAKTRTVHEHRGEHADVTTEDMAVVIFVTLRGALGTLTVSQVAPGRKNRLALEISGTARSIFFDQERPESLWLGARDESRIVLRDPSVLSGPALRFGGPPAGHSQGFQDAFNSFVADSYDATFGETPDGLPTFRDGLRAVVMTEAVLASAKSSEWVDVPTTRSGSVQQGKPSPPLPRDAFVHAPADAQYISAND